MKTIKIFGLPSHQTKERTSGVDFARVIQPIEKLNGYTDGEVRFETQVFDINEKTDWLGVCQEFDVIYFNYLNSPWGFAAMGAMARKLGKKMVMDLDDNLWEIRKDNPAHVAYYKGSQALRDFTAICNEVDYVTVTNRYLKNVVVNNTYKRHEKVAVFPNFVDLNLYKHRATFKNDARIQLLHYGSTTHFEDLSNDSFIQGVDKVMREYPNVHIKFVGAFLPQLQELWGMRFAVAYGDSDIYKWINNHFPKYMDEADILIVPLEENSYTRCKSAIKWTEASSARKVGCWQDIRQYQEVIKQGENGFLCKTADDWYNSIKYLIDHPDKRQQMGEQAFTDVSQDWTIQAHAGDYAEFFKKVVDNK
jgi:glycosyltransferase involved in cell wall biosynthesis